MLFKEEDLKTKLYYKRYDFTFPIVNFLFISSNIQASPAFHNSYVTLELVPNALNFWTELSCWGKSYVALRLKSSLQKVYVRHHNLVIHISNDNGSFTFYADVLFSPALPRLLPDSAVYMSNTVGVHHKFLILYMCCPSFCVCSRQVLIVYICCPSWVILCLFTSSIDCVYMLPILSYFVFVHV